MTPLPTDQPTVASISGPVPTTGLREDADYYEVIITYQGMPLRYRLHNEWDYGVDCRGAMPDCPDRWYGTYMTPGALDLPAETVQALRTIWESLFRPATAPAVVKRVGEYDPITKDYPAYVSIDGGPEEYIGSRRTQGGADRLCDEYAYNFYSDHHTPEKAVEIALAMGEPEPAPPVDDGPADNWGGFRSPDARRPTPDARRPTPDARPAAHVNWSSAAAHLARLHRSARATLTPATADTCYVLFELALTDPCALAEFLRAHTPVQRDMLAWRYAGWLSRRHGITVLPAYIATNWTALLGDTETDAGRAGDAQRCAESGS